MPAICSRPGSTPARKRSSRRLPTGGPMTPGALARALDVRPPTITKTITRLEEQGFVARAASKEDGRQVLVQLTEAGRNVLGVMGKAIAKAEKQALKGLKKKERKQLEKILGKIEGNLVIREDTGEDEQSERD
ncbi:MarR family transcriptional regulator [Oceaniradius stylonematis]